MAIWKIDRHPTKITVVYRNLHSGTDFNCGDQHATTDVGLILEWVRSEADPGDLVLVDGRVVMNIMPMLHEVMVSDGPGYLN